MIIDYENVEISSPRHPILNSVNLQVEEGELIYIVGPVGSGKTSLLRTIYGETKPTSGKAVVLGTDMMQLRQSKVHELRRKIGMDFQDFHFLPDLTVGENLDFVLRATGWNDKSQRRRRIIEVLEEVDMPGKINHYTYELSGGEKQCVSIARALLNSPKLILADEPTCNLDNENGEAVIRLLDALCKNGTAVIITTHNLTWLQKFPGKIYTCQGGRLENGGSPLAEED